MTEDENNLLDEQLNDAFSSDGDFNNDTEEETQTTEDYNEGTESLDDLIQDQQETTTEKNTKNNQEINNTQQSIQQPTNKRTRNNNSKDLVDENGNVIARAGAERRFYEENVKLKRDRDVFNTQVLPKIREQYDAMKKRVETYQQTFDALRASDMTPEDIQTGIELMRKWKQSPQETLKYLLTNAKSYGINVEGLTSGVDVAAINQMLDEKLQPFMQEREARLQEIQIKNQAQNEYNNFMQRFPDAKVHTKELAYLIRKQPNLSLDSAYYMLRTHYAENGFDFNTPLEQILKGRQQKPNNASFNMPNTNQTINGANLNKNVASVNTSYNDIIKSVLRDTKF